MSMGNPLHGFMQALFEQHSTSDASVIVIDDNCAMMPESVAWSAKHEPLSHSNRSQSSMPSLSRWDSHCMKIDRDERCCPLPKSTEVCPIRPSRRGSLIVDSDETDSEDSRIRRQASPPIRPRRRSSIIVETFAPIVVVSDGAWSDSSESPSDCSDSSSSSIDAFLVNLNKTLKQSSSKANGILTLFDDEDEIGETSKIQSDRFRRPAITINLDRPSKFPHNAPRVPYIKTTEDEGPSKCMAKSKTRKSRRSKSPRRDVPQIRKFASTTA